MMSPTFVIWNLLLVGLGCLLYLGYNQPFYNPPALITLSAITCILLVTGAVFLREIILGENVGIEILADDGITDVH